MLMKKEISRSTYIFLDQFRINPRKSDLKLLSRIVADFASLPWENLSKYLKKGKIVQAGGSRGELLRESEEVLRGYALQGTGGTCFSLCNALLRICRDLGFHAEPVMADMRHGENIHCGLIVHLQARRFYLDPGYLLPEAVELLQGQIAQASAPGHRLEYRPLGDRDEFELFTVNKRGGETFRYRLRPWPVAEPVFRRFWLQSFDSSGMNSLYLNRLEARGRLSAHNYNLRVDRGDSKQNVKLKGVYVDKIVSEFGLSEQVVEEALSLWKRNRGLDD